MPNDRFAVKILVDGDLRVLEKDGWEGKGLAFPRADYGRIRRDRTELRATGVYVLLGPAEGNALPKLYVGKGQLQKRLDSHSRDGDKDWWTTTSLFMSSSNRLSNAHWEFIESRLIDLGKRSAEVDCLNVVVALKKLPEIDEPAAELFLQEVLQCLPFLGFSGLFDLRSSGVSSGASFSLSGKGVEATMKIVGDAFVILNGSSAVLDEDVVDSCPEGHRQIRSKLLASGVLSRSADRLLFREDCHFRSSSTAAGVILGNSTAGPLAFRDRESGRTLKEYLEAAVPGSR